MLTKSDLQLIKQLFEEGFTRLFDKAFDKKFEQARKLLTDDILVFKDEIVGEIQDLRDEVAIVAGYRDQIEDHEIRIEKIEKAVNIN